MGSEERCEGCRFWCTRDDKEGACRFNPPVVVQVSSMGYVTSSGCLFPQTSRYQWCGKWEHRREESNVV